jgi:serine/threonine-protein kinase
MKPAAVGVAAPLGPTGPYRGDEAESHAPATRCRIAREGGDTALFRGEVETLLRGRLRIASLIALAPLVFFLLKFLLDPTSLALFSRIDVPFHTVVVLTVVATAGVLWSPLCLSLRTLRVLELIMFGLIAAFFGWMQFEAFYQDKFYRIAEALHDTEGQAAEPGTNVPLVGLLTGATTIRWIILIVIYGVFIPNTWRRCLLLVSLVALTSIALSAAAAQLSGRLNEGMLSALSIMAVLMATAVAIAVFGSYRIEVLHRQAFAAQQLGQYRLKKRLGVGGMGEVYLAEHLLLRRPCAVKLIRPEQAGDRTTLQRFEREVRAMATLTHWNTVEVYDYGHAEDGTFYYVMEYLPGHNLENLVERYGPLPAGRVIHLLRQVCQALREAHGVGLLHRDIKPSNIITCERGGVFDVAKLLDFGLVHASGVGATVEKLTMVGTVLGSPPFMSPEQAAGKHDLGPASDIYSLGGVAYFLLTGQAPFVRETLMQIFLAHAYEPVVPPSHVRPDIPPDVEAVVLRCLGKKPEERFADAASLEKALARCRSAEEWTEEAAAAWWKQPEHRAATDTYEISALTTAVAKS